MASKGVAIFFDPEQMQLFDQATGDLLNAVKLRPEDRNMQLTMATVAVQAIGAYGVGAKSDGISFDKIELWDPGSYEKYLASLTETYEEIAEKVMK